jgi:flagellar hook assembly protein FlgD
MYPNDLNGAKELFQHVDSTTSDDEVYAFPVPFSPLRGQQVDFHFVVEEAGNVTLEIYDFAMNLVARPIDGVYYTPGIYPGEGRQGITWDGRNGNGDNVAVGVYYFRVDLPSGESRWGKLAVIP